MVGHSHYVRGLAWNHEVPWLLLSGSWDSTVKAWDIRSSACIFTLDDHNADVYGIATNPDRPFVVATCSRDTTLRFWQIEEPLIPVIVRN